MLFEPNILCSKRSHVDHTEEIRFPRFNLDGQILGIVEKCCLGDRLCARWIGDIDETRQEGLHTLMVPVGKSQNDFLIIKVLERVVVVMDDEGSTDTIRILTALMAVVPVRARLVNLSSSAYAVECLKTYRNPQ